MDVFKSELKTWMVGSISCLKNYFWIKSKSRFSNYIKPVLNRSKNLSDVKHWKIAHYILMP